LRIIFASLLTLMIACSGSSTPADPATPSEKSPVATKQIDPAVAAKQIEAAKDLAVAKTADTPDGALFHPEQATETAPETYAITFETTKGPFVVDVTRAWSPIGADRLYNMVKAGFFTDIGFFRVVPGFVVQFGLNGDPGVNKAWRNARIKDDPVAETNARGTIVFATSGPNTRTTQLFINFNDNANLDAMGFSPLGKVRDMANVDKINAEYGQRPNQGSITNTGNAYLKKDFPNLDFITKATLSE
jgi:peptidyl-prolyl cis-trans isomerase A (cyclophilin A)